MKNKLFEGIATALYTPITDGKIDFEEFERIIDKQLDSKINALLFLGTTGEAPTITEREREKIASFAVNKVGKKAVVLVGCGSNSTAKTVELVLQAKRLGADGAVCVTPYYNVRSQEGISAHYSEIDKRCAFPFFVYNVPSRTRVDVAPETYVKLSNLQNIVGVKECVSNRRRLNFWRNFSERLPVYCGSEQSFYAFLKIGASGLFSVSSNVIPLKILDIFEDFKKDYKKKTKGELRRLEKFFDALFSDANPIPLKKLIEETIKKGYQTRLPLTSLDKEKTEVLMSEYKKIGGLND